jgi:hypothetical protein
LTAPQEYNGCKTIWEIFEKSVKDRPDNKFLGTRNAEKEGKPYEFKTYKEIYEIV